MQRDTAPDVAAEIASELGAWRARALNVLLIVAAIVAAPAIVFTIVEAVRNPEQWPAALTFLVIYLFIVGLAVFRRLDCRVRAWGLLLLTYAAGVLAFARGGLAGDGRVYLLVVPALALILAGARSGLIMVILSLLTYAVFAATAHLGWMERWLVRLDNPLTLPEWIFASAPFAMLLIVLVVLQWLFGRRQTTIALKKVLLHKETERLRAFNENIVQSMAEGIVVQDAGGYFTFINPAAADLLDYTPDELLGQHWTAIIPPDQQSIVQAAGERRMRGEADQYELELVRKDGKRLAVLVGGSPRFEEGRFAGTITVFADITERKRAEEALRESEESLKAQYKGIPVPTYTWQRVGENLVLVDYNDAAAAITQGKIADFVGIEAKELYGDRSEILEELSRSLTEKTSIEREMLYRYKSTGESKYLAVKYVFVSPDRVLVHTEDISERKRAEEALKKRAAQLALLNDIGGKIAAVLELDSVLDRAVRLTQEGFGYHHVAIFGVDRERGELVMKTRAGSFAHLFPPDHRLKLGQGMVGWVGRHGETLLTNDVNAEPRYVNLYPDLVPTLSELSVPIRVDDEIVGVLDAQSPHLDAFDENDVMVMETLANQIAVASENSRLFESVRQQRERLRVLTARLAEAEEAERRRVMQILHDQVGQNLTALGLNLSLVRAQMGQDTSQLVCSRLDDSLALVEKTSEQVRCVMTDLRPPMLDDYGLVPTLQWYGKWFSSRTGIAFDVEIEQAVPRLPAQVENALFRIAQEALNNVAKHASASQVRVNVSVDSEAVRLEVADDGVGFDRAPLAASGRYPGWGLLTMVERAEAVGARCRIESHPEQGTWVIVEVTR